MSQSPTERLYAQKEAERQRQREEAARSSPPPDVERAQREVEAASAGGFEPSPGAIQILVDYGKSIEGTPEYRGEIIKPTGKSPEQTISELVQDQEKRIAESAGRDYVRPEDRTPTQRLEDSYAKEEARAKTEAVKLGLPGWMVVKDGDKTSVLTEKQVSEIKAKAPELYKVLQKEGYQSFVKAVNARNFEVLVTNRRIRKVEKEWAEASPQEKFLILQQKGGIPPDAVFERIDEDGTIYYKFPGKKGTALNSYEGASADDYMKWAAEQSASDSVTPVRREPEILKAYEKVYWDEVKRNAKEGAIGLTPIAGTVYFWKDMPPWAQVLSIAGDVLFVASLARPLIKSGVMARVATLGSESGKETRITTLLKEGAGESRAVFKEISSNLEQPFNKLNKARLEYAQNLAKIKTTEEVLNTNFGELRPEIERTLLRLQGQTHELAQNLRLAADDFANAQRAVIKNITSTRGRSVTTKLGGGLKKEVRAGYDVESLVSSGFADDVVRDTRQIVEVQFEKIPPVKRIDRQILAAAKEIDATRRRLPDMVKQYGMDSLEVKYSTRKLYDLNVELLKLKAQKAVALSGDAPDLARRLTEVHITRNALENDRAKLFTEWKLQPLKEKDYEGIARLLNERIKVLQREEAAITIKYRRSLKAFEIEWAKPIQRSSGRTIISEGKLGKKTPRTGGGGIKTSGRPQAPLMPAVAGLRVIAIGDDWIEYTYKPATIDVPGKETVTVEPQPYWAGEVTTAPVKPDTKPLIPETKPVPRPPFEPAPGKITWTPAVVLAPKLNPQEGMVIEVNPLADQARTQAAIGKASNVYKNAISRGLSPSEAISLASKTSSLVQFRTLNKQELKEIAQELTRQQQQSLDITTVPVTEIGIGITTISTTGFNEGKGKIKPPVPKLSKKDKDEEWTPAQVKSALAWKSGAVVHAIKAPYRRGIDERTFSVKRLPPGLQLLSIYEGKGSAQRSIKPFGKAPQRLTVDVGNQDAIITRANGKLNIRFQRDSSSRTISHTTIKRNRNGKRRHFSRIIY